MQKGDGEVRRKVNEKVVRRVTGEQGNKGEKREGGGLVSGVFPALICFDSSSAGSELERVFNLDGATQAASPPPAFPSCHSDGTTTVTVSLVYFITSSSSCFA